MKILTWQNPEQLIVAQDVINDVKLKYCGIKVFMKTTHKFREYVKSVIKGYKYGL